MKQNRTVIKAYMLREWEDHLDRRTNEVNATTMAEDACSHFNDYEDDYSIDQAYYDIAYEVAIQKEKELNRR